MKKNHSTAAVILLIAVIVSVSCKKNTSDNTNQELIGRMKDVTDSIIRNTHVPGIIALVVDRNKGIDWLYTAGYSDIPNKLPMDPDYTIRAGSNTKTMVGTVLFQLIAEGKLSLDDTLSKFYPNYPHADIVTIAQLCNMSSGIFSYFEDPLFLEAVAQDPGRRWMPDTCIKIGLSHPLYFNPGAGWHYSQTNTYILGRLIEKLTGNSLTDEIYTRIVAPLGLVNTNLIDYGTTLPGVHGRGYYAGTYEEGADVTEYLDASTLWAAGSAYSTPRELQKYVEKLVGGGFLPDSLQQLRLQDHFISCDMFSEYGLCLSRRGTFYGNYGDMPGFNTAMYHSNAKNCTVIISFNCQLNVKTEYLFYRFMDILYGKDF